MKNNRLFGVLFCLTSIVFSGCTADYLKGEKGDTGPKGIAGIDGISVESIVKTGSEGLVDTYTITYSNGLTSSFVVVNGSEGKQGIQGLPGEDGHTPEISISEDGYWIIDGEKTESVAVGVNGNKGDPGVSITNAFINSDGDLIVELSNGTILNGGHIKDVIQHTVNFYCDDLLVDTQIVSHGEKAHTPVLEDFVVNHWYIDKEFEFEWLLYGCVVTEDISLYGDYRPVIRSVSFNKTENIEVDEYGYGNASKSEKEISVSKATETSDYLTILEERGILFNKSDLGVLDSVFVDIESEGFVSSKLYFGNYPFSFEHSVELHSGVNQVNLMNCEYFTLQNDSSNQVKIKEFTANYGKKAKWEDNNLPSVVIDTKNSQTVTSRTQYVECNVSTIGASKDVSGLKAQIKVRGNSTAYCPKKPYRIKLDKKNSLFGYAKAKNWSLLAEYMDGSNMHNYSALKFAKMIRGEETFGTEPLHVNVIMNGQNIGLYTFCEHIDAKDGRLNIEQDNLWEKSFDEINFYIERDLSTAQDSTEIEGVTYFDVPLENYYITHYCFALKYPEMEDFEEELEDGTVLTHETEFQAYFDALKSYMTDICNGFIDYYHDSNEYENLTTKVDMKSLAMYSVVDQAFGEGDHGQKSFKMYRKNGGLLEFGPNWDYDSCAYSLPYKGTYVLDPFTVGGSYNRTFFGEKWGYTLFNDTIHGRQFFKEIWDEISIETIDSFLENQLSEIYHISELSTYDCGYWMNNCYYCLFDNLLYYFRFISNQLPYLKNFYC